MLIDLGQEEDGVTHLETVLEAEPNHPDALRIVEQLQLLISNAPQG